MGLFALAVVLSSHATSVTGGGEGGTATAPPAVGVRTEGHEPEPRPLLDWSTASAPALLAASSAHPSAPHHYITPCPQEAEPRLPNPLKLPCPNLPCFHD